MKLTQWLRTREGAILENRLSRMVIGALVIANLILIIILGRSNTTVVMVPPNLEERSSVGASHAGPETQVAWGLAMANLFGNATPRTVSFLNKSVARHLSPSIYNQVLEALDIQVKELEQEQISIQFIPALARWDKETSKVIVTGEAISRGLQGQERREIKTYVMGFVVQNYKLLLDSLDVKKGHYGERVVDGRTKASAAQESDVNE